MVSAVQNAAATSAANTGRNGESNNGQQTSLSPSCGYENDCHEEHSCQEGTDLHQQQPALPRQEQSPGVGARTTATSRVLSQHQDHQDRDHDLHRDPAFDAPPPQAPPDAANTLLRVFLVLRNSCAGCPANNEALRHTGLAEAASTAGWCVEHRNATSFIHSDKVPLDPARGLLSPCSVRLGFRFVPRLPQLFNYNFSAFLVLTANVKHRVHSPRPFTATWHPLKVYQLCCRWSRCHSLDTTPKTTAMQALQFAVDQAPYACGAVCTHPAAATVVGQEGTPAATVATSDAAGVRLAVRAGLQFACNYCVGSEENKALLWDAWFPRRLMVRA